MKQGLHNTPELLTKQVQEQIDTISFANYEATDAPPDYILLGYGLCSNGMIGLTSHDIPLVIPRTDDCIALFLGSQQRYLDYFNSHDGIYWYNTGWMHSAYLPNKENIEAKREQYIELYGEDNAEFLMEQENSWVQNYQYATYINNPFLDIEAHRAFTKQSAADFQWNYDELDGDLSLLSDLLSGNFDPEKFLVVPPHCRITEAFDGSKFSWEKAEEAAE